MKLPIRTLPQYSLTLPVSNKEIKYRPYTVREEQIISMAMMSDEEKDKTDAIIQVCENCSTIESINDILPAEVEYLFMKIRATSESPKVDVTYTIDPEKCGWSENEEKYENCPKEIVSYFDINDDVKIEYDENELNQYATRAKNGNWIVDLGEDLKIEVKPRALKEVNDNAIYEIVESIIDEVENEVYLKDQYSITEFMDWFNALPVTAVSNLTNFLQKLPECKAKLKFKCKKCSKIFEETETGIISFLI